MSTAAHDSENASATVLRGLFGRDTIYLGLWAVQLGAAALFTPISTRLLGPSRFGLVVSCIAVMQVLVAIGGLGLQTAVQRQYAETGERDARRLITLAGGGAALTFVLADLTGPDWTAALGLGHYPSAVRFAVGWAALTAVSNAALGLLRSRDQLGRFATVSLLQSVAAEGMSLLLVLSVRRSASEYVLGQLIAQALAMGLAVWMTQPLPVTARHLRLAASALRFSIPLVPGALATFALDACDRLVIQHDLGAGAVARYAVAYNIGSIPILLLGVLDGVWMPRVFALSDARLRDTVLSRSRNGLYALLIPVVVGLGIGAPLLLHLWAPSSYRPDGLLLVVALVAVSAIPVAGGLSHSRALRADGRSTAVGAATVFAGAANLGFNVALVPVLGIEGSAIATLASFAVLQLALMLPARRGHRVLPPPRALVVGLAAAVGVACAAAALPVDLPLMAVRFVIAAACAAAGAAMLRLLAGHGDSGRTRWLGRRMSTMLGGEA